MNIKSHGRRVAFTLFHTFYSSQETRIQDGYGNARRQSFDPVPIKLAKTNWIYLGLSLRELFFFGESFYSYCFLLYLLFTNFTFLKNQYMMVEYKGALDEISKTFRSLETWYENLTLI